MMTTLSKEMYKEAYTFVEEVLHDEKDASTYQSILSYFKQHLDAYAYLAYIDNTIVSLLAYDPEAFRIAFVLTKQSHRHKDIASSLLDTLKQKAQSFNIARITIDTPRNLTPFYQANGFEEIGDSTSQIVSLEYLVSRNMLSKTVTVIIDRPYGSIHPLLQDVTYPYNYGYIKQDMQQNIEFQDAYVIGVQQPLETFTGYVAGIIYHKEDTTSRWIVAPLGMVVDHEATIQLLGIEEQFYSTRIIWNS